MWRATSLCRYVGRVRADAGGCSESHGPAPVRGDQCDECRSERKTRTSYCGWLPLSTIPRLHPLTSLHMPRGFSISTRVRGVYFWSFASLLAVLTHPAIELEGSLSNYIFFPLEILLTNGEKLVSPPIYLGPLYAHLDE